MIEIDFDFLDKNNLNVTEYLALYKSVFPDKLPDDKYKGFSVDFLELEKKGLVKVVGTTVYPREAAKKLFKCDEDLFLKWLNRYPVKVNKTGGGSRSLSPAGDETIAGRKLRKKWNQTFKDNFIKQEIAIEVLEAEVAMRIKSNDLEYMCEAHRWLNEGFFEKYEYLLDEATDVVNGVVSYEEDWE